MYCVKGIKVRAVTTLAMTINISVWPLSHLVTKTRSEQIDMYKTYELISLFCLIIKGFVGL